MPRHFLKTELHSSSRHIRDRATHPACLTVNFCPTQVACVAAISASLSSSSSSLIFASSIARDYPDLPMRFNYPLPYVMLQLA